MNRKREENKELNAHYFEVDDLNYYNYISNLTNN